MSDEHLKANQPGGPKVCAVMTMPRFGLIQPLLCVGHSLFAAGIATKSEYGVYWDQGICRLFESVLDEKFDYCFTVDYDTIFYPEHVRELLRLIISKPEAFAVFTAQIIRGTEHLLCRPKGYGEGESRAEITREMIDQDLMPASVGHFGLTVFRVSELAKFPRPWMVAKPNEDGKWMKGKVDADWSFWLRAEKAGLKAFMAPRVRIGHAQTIITWPDDNLCPVHQHVHDWQERGEPDCVHPVRNYVNQRRVNCPTSPLYGHRRPILRMEDQRTSPDAPDKPLKLNLGCGPQHLEDYVNIDKKEGGEAYPLRYEDNTVDEIRASHLLEHFGMRQVAAVVADWVRALKPGGILKLAVPNFDYIAKAYTENRGGEPFMAYLFGAQADEDDFHKSGFDWANLAGVMRQAGLIHITRSHSEITDCAALPVSLNLQGIKGGPGIKAPEGTSFDAQIDERLKAGLVDVPTQNKK